MELVYHSLQILFGRGSGLLGGVVTVLMQIAYPNLHVGSTVTYVYVVMLGTVSEGENLAESAKARHMSVRGGEKKLPYATSNAELL